MAVKSHRRIVIACSAVLLVGLAVDVSRPPENQLSARVMIASIHLYRMVGDRVGSALGVRCRMRPSCSRYSESVIRDHGALKGGWLTARRLLRCGPWTEEGTADPPPPAP
jgi:putative membrane protein insertion efficiency factor